MFPTPPAGILTRRCLRCGKRVRADRLVAGGFGEDCAQALGLIPPPGRVESDAHDGPDLLDLLGGGRPSTTAAGVPNAQGQPRKRSTSDATAGGSAGQGSGNCLQQHETEGT